MAQEKKLIRSPDTLRELKRTFGESLGIHVESEIRTESRYMDLRSVYEKLKMFNYNPVNYFRFVLFFKIANWCNRTSENQIFKDVQTTYQHHQYLLLCQTF